MWEDKETTAPIPSVAPDGEQPSAFARTVSITEIEETRKQFGKIQIMTMPELMETRFRVRPAVIDGLLPAGTYLLAGAPKIGKSFLVLQMAYQVSMGAPFLGFSSRQGTVLYLALEDTCERLQKRLAQMTEQDSEHLILSVFSETLDEGLTERLSDFWSEHTDTVLIIIDTLQRVRSRTPDGGSYAADYDTLARLKEFSDTFGVTVLIVHHTRKEGAEDFLSPSQSVEKERLELGFFCIDMVEWARVMKDAGTRENGSRSSRVRSHRPTGAEGAFAAKDRCSGGLHTAV